jgi:HlyD family secretion protein
VRLAKLDHEKFVDGDFPQQESAAEGKKKIAEEAYIQAKETYEFNKRQVDKGTTQQNIAEAARIKMQQAKFDLAAAEKELEVLQDFTKKRTLEELASNAKQLVGELERVKIKAEAAKVQFEKDLEAKDLTLKVEKDKLDRYKKQIEACTLRAPQDGEVVYANLQSEGRGRSSQQGPAVEVGASVYERQPIINLPDITQMKVSCRVHESQIGALRKGLPARVRIDAYSQEPYTGVVASVSSVPMTGKWPNMDLREYDTQIYLTDSDERIRKLRPGLTAAVEILIDNRNDVLQVPVQGVVSVVDKHLSYVRLPDGKVEPREVEVGFTNQSHVEVLKGLAEGESIVLNPRTRFAKEISEFEAKLIAEKPKEIQAMAAEVAKQPLPAAVAGPGGEGGPGGPGGGGRGGPGGGRGNFDPSAAFARMDADSDGSLTQTELPEPMQAAFASMDGNSDGKISMEEFTAAGARFRGGRRGGGGPGGPPGGGGPPGAGGPPAGGGPPAAAPSAG